MSCDDKYIVSDEKSVCEIIDKIGPIFREYTNNANPDDDVAQIQINIITSIQNLMIMGYNGLFVFLKNPNKQDFLEEFDCHYQQVRERLEKDISDYIADKTCLEILNEPIPITRKKQ